MSTGEGATQMSQNTTSSAQHDSGTSERLPWAGLLALAMTGFICILTETVPAGLLLQIGDGLGVSEALAGQLVTLYALGSLLAAIPLTAATRGWRRRPLLLLCIIGFLVFNTVTAFSSNYILTLAARFLAGICAGVLWGMIAGYARRMVPESLKGRAMAVAMVGTPLAPGHRCPCRNISWHLRRLACCVWNHVTACAAAGLLGALEAAGLPGHKCR